MRRNRSGVLGAVLIALVLVAAACGSGEEAETKDGPTINVGSGNFPESNHSARSMRRSSSPKAIPLNAI